MTFRVFILVPNKKVILKFAQHFSSFWADLKPNNKIKSF